MNESLKLPFKNDVKLALGLGISFARVGPIFTKYSLNAWAIRVLSVTIFPPITTPSANGLEFVLFRINLMVCQVCFGLDCSWSNFVSNDILLCLFKEFCSVYQCLLLFIQVMYLC